MVRGLLTLIFLMLAANAGAQTKRSVIRFTAADGTALVGDLMLPEGKAPFPAVVIIHGSGPSDRTNEWAAAIAESFAARGIAALLPDKRGSGESKGDWRVASFEVLADDAGAAVRALRDVRAVRPDAIGVVGLSQGGHIAPLAAAREPAIAFVISMVGSTVPINEQARDEVMKAAERSNFSEADRKQLLEIHLALERYARSGEGWEDYMQKIQQASSGAMGPVVKRFPATQDHWVWKWARAVGEFDPLPHWRALSKRGLLVYGANDTQIRVLKSLERIEPLLKDSKPGTLTVMFAGGVGHSLGGGGDTPVRNLMDSVAAWTRASIPASAPPSPK